jgi:mRNA interferase MazF
VAPLTEWKGVFATKPWLVRVDPDVTNCLTKTSIADVLQLRGVDLARFSNRIGRLSAGSLAEIADAIGIVAEVP